jgi:sugar phosphate isomerase/epimerase
MKLSVQLYSLREAAKTNFPFVLESLAKQGYDGVEFAGLHGNSPDQLRKVLDRVGLVASSAHGAVFDVTKWDEVKRDADALGYKHLVGGFGENDFKSEEAIRAAAIKVNRAVDHFVPMGYTVGIHNHWWEYDAPNKGDLLLSLCPKAHPQFDVYWVTSGGADPVGYIRRYAGRVKLIHIKDGPLDREKAMTAVGKGKVDIKGVVGAALESKVEWGIVELDRCDTDMLEAVGESAQFLKPLFTR